MILTANQLVELYEGVIKPFGHPDPLGYITRALIVSEGDPEYIGVDGRRGFMPVLPDLALELVGAQEVQSLEANIIATLTIDRLYFDELGSIDKMIIAFEFGIDSISETLTKNQSDFIEDVNDSREESQLIMYPPLATVNDVIDILEASLVDPRLSTKEKDFFQFLVEN